MATNERESRRRRIVSRGSDRLALITGQIENLPSPSPSDSHPQDLQTPCKLIHTPLSLSLSVCFLVVFLYM